MDPRATNRARERLMNPPEDFRMPPWIGAPDHNGIRLSMTTTMFQMRFPLGRGPDPEYSVRPWLPPGLKDIILVDSPIFPAIDAVTELVPILDQGAVQSREVIGALGPYAPATPKVTDV